MTDEQLALEHARIYRGLGFVPLPSRSDDKRPMMTHYAHYRNDAVPAEVYTEARWNARNIQVFTGAQTSGDRKLLVVDCDGDQAHEAWLRMCQKHGHQPSPWSVETGSGGRHYWYLLSERIQSCPTRQIWGLWDTFGRSGEGAWSTHAEVKILGEGALAVAPPSIHPKTGKRYRWVLAPSHSHLLRLPPQAPRWLLSMPRVEAPKARDHGGNRPTLASQNLIRAPSGATRQDILDAIPDKLALARSWGLRALASTPNGQGWITCRAVGREDRHPSAAFHVEDGIYKDFATGETCSLLDLGVLLGHFQDWKSCLDSLHMTRLPR